MNSSVELSPMWNQVTLCLALMCVMSGCGGDDATATQDTTATVVDASVSEQDTGAGEDTQQAAVDTKPSVSCHPVQNTGCPQGQHCVWEGNSITCVDDGVHDVGEDCTDGQGCKVGVCVGAQGSDKSVCSPHCLANLECASGICNKLNNSKGKVCDMGIEVEQCNPLNPQCDGAGQACYPTGNGFICLSAGGNEDGQPCPEDNSCKPGLACVGKTGLSDGVCRKICEIGKANATCDDITAQCAPLLGSASVGYCGS